VVVLHEVFGRQPEIDRVVERFAAAGYAAVAPDLMSAGPKPLCIARCMRAMATGEGEPVEQVRRTGDWLRAEAGLPADKVGVIGFCMGGGFALAVARHFAAVSTNYGVVPDDKVLKGAPPAIGCYGARDRMFVPYARLLEERMKRLGVPVETHVFPDVGHSFLTDGNHPVASFLVRPLMGIVPYNPAVAEEGWRHILGFFDRQLA
jgi:carboxymethylenebutenolidase